MPKLMIPLVFAAGLLAGVLGKQFLWPALSEAATQRVHGATQPRTTATEYADLADAAQRQPPRTDEDEASTVVHLSPEARRIAGIELAVAGPGRIADTVTVPGEVNFNADQVAHIVPPLSGIVRSVNKHVGGFVKEGETLAILDSRELAEACASLRVTRKRLEVASKTLTRFEELETQGLVPHLELLNAQKDRDEAAIEATAAESTLTALGLNGNDIQALEQESRVPGEFDLRAPMDGTVIEKHVTTGEAVSGDSDAFVVADLETVWVNLTVFQKHLGAIRTGQTAIISAKHNDRSCRGVVSYLSPIVDESTRTATARIVVDNEGGAWPPGLLVTAALDLEPIDVGVAVARDAVQTLDGGTGVLFVPVDDGFETTRVETGHSDATSIEIRKGLVQGQQYVAKGAFVLKSELAKSSLAEDND